MKLLAVQGDITHFDGDIIVNAANNSLLGGGGVDGAIHRAGGPIILEECKKIVAEQGELPTGEAVITSAGNMPAKFVIHTVGPIWNGGENDEAKLLANCYSHSLELAVENNCQTIAFPNISTGVYGFPKEEAAVIAVKTVSNFLKRNRQIQQVVFVCFDEENLKLTQTEIDKFR